VTTPQRLLVPVLALACLGLGIYAYSERMARVASEDRLYSAQAENARLATQAATATVFPAPATGPVPSSAEAVPVSPASPEGPSVEGPRRGPTDGRSPGAEFMTMMESPEMQQLMNLRARGNLDGRYAALFKTLGLSPDQLQRFQQLLLDKQNTTRDVLAAMRSQGLAPNRENGEQMRSLVQSANAEIDAQIRSELGEATFAQYQNYEQTQPQRALVERVQQRLSYTAQPLSDQQAASLVNLLAEATPATTSAARPRRLLSGTVGGNVPITADILAQAQTILSPSQLTALQQLQQEQEAQAQLMRRTRRTVETTGSSPTAGNR
jgi:hypothetical protein